MTDDIGDAVTGSGPFFGSVTPSRNTSRSIKLLMNVCEVRAGTSGE